MIKKKELFGKMFLVVLMTVFCFVGSASAEGAAPAANPLGSFFPLIVIFVIFYFFLIRPQQKKAKEHQVMLNTLKKDDKVLTTGGIYGTITAIKGEVLEVKIAEGVKVQISKSSVSALQVSENTVINPEIVK